MRDIKKTKQENIVYCLEEFKHLKGEEERVAFIYSLKELIKKEAPANLSAFFRFVCENIDTDSEKLRTSVINMCRWIISSIPDPPNKKESVILCHFIDKAIGMMEDNYKEEFSQYEYISDLPVSIYKSLEVLVNRVLLSRSSYRRAYEKHLKEVPSFMECTWKKVPCNKKDCPVCGEEFSSTLNPEKEIFPNMISKKPFGYVAVMEWNEEMFEVTEEAEEEGDFWMFTNSASDLFWYSNVLLAKCSLLAKEEYLSFESNYARYVVRECLKIMRRSLKEIISFDPLKAEELKDLLYDIEKIEKDLLRL